MGNPVRLIAGPGQENDIVQAENLIKGFAPAHVLADKAYDADTFFATLQIVGAKPVIPPRRNRKVQRNYDRTLYKERNLVERFFNKLKHFRRVATRYDKLLVNFLGFVKIAAIAILMRSLNCHYDLGQPLIYNSVFCRIMSFSFTEDIT